MKKLVHNICKCLVVSAFIASGLSATTYSNKTFLMPRPALVNMAIEYPAWYSMTRYTPKNQFGLNLQVAGFYQESQKADALGKYFGVEGKSQFEIGWQLQTTDVPYYYIFHGCQEDKYTTAAKVKFHPKQTIYGARLDLYQDLSFFIEKLYFKVSSPIICVKNDLKSTISDTVDLFANDNLKNYFAGNYENIADEHNLQTKLTHAKIAGKQSNTGFGDVDMILGYKLWDQKKFKLALNLGLTIPAANKAKGDYVFEPIRGNGQHFGFGGGVDGRFKIAKSENFTLNLIYALNYRYLLKNDETRFLPLNKEFEWPYTAAYTQYWLLGKVGAAAGSALIPAANILNTSLYITPGSQFEGLADFGFKYKNFILDLGYNCYFRQAESGKLKTNPFGEDQYAVSKYDFDTHTAFSSTNYLNGHILNLQDLDIDAALTPSQLTHKLLGGLGFVVRKNDYSALINIGASYEFATSNSAIENWAVWGKIGFAF